VGQESQGVLADTCQDHGRSHGWKIRRDVILRKSLSKIQSEQLSFQSPIIDRWKSASASGKKALKIFLESYVFVWTGRSENAKKTDSLIGTNIFLADYREEEDNETARKNIQNNISSWEYMEHPLTFDFSGFNFIWNYIFLSVCLHPIIGKFSARL
jgi:hypothetical protein